MITCLAIDDEPLALKQLESYIRKTPFLSLVAACHSVEEAREAMRHNSVLAIFTDINMPDCSGLQFVRELETQPLVVFSTAYSEYALESYRLDAIDYLLKPYSYQDFLKAALKIKQYYEWKASAESVLDAPATNDSFFVRADNQSVKVVFDNILYVEARSEYIRIHFLTGKPIMTFMSIKLMNDSLPTGKFMRIHRSYLVAVEQITSVRRSEVELSDGTVLPVSSSYKEELQRYIEARSVGRK